MVIINAAILLFNKYYHANTEAPTEPENNYLIFFYSLATPMESNFIISYWAYELPR